MFWSPAAEAANNVKTIPAPVGGLNAFDSLVAMPESDAIILQNWWCQPYGVSIRKGYREWATGMPAEVATLASWADVNGAQKFFAWSGTGMYDISTSAVVGAAIVTGLTNSIWDHVNMVNAAGSSLIAVNGLDDGIIYKTSGVARIILGDGIVVNTWAGIDPKNAVSPTVHQHRLWVVQKNTAAGWFLPPDAVQGTFLKYDFGPLFSRGGFLQFLATWTIDDGSGAKDLLVACSSRGEVAVYGGTDPEDDTKWFLVGVYYIGAPVEGRRSHCKAGGDQYIITQLGIVSMSEQIISTRVEEQASIMKSNKIKFLISEIASTFGTLFGWSLSYFPKENMLIANIPSVTSEGNIQFAINQITGAWTQFIGMDAASWGAFGSTLMFGDYTGRVLLAWTGNSDNINLAGTGGEGVTASAQQAYNYMGGGFGQKQVGMYRPVFITTAPVAIKSAIFYDFDTEDLSPPNAPPPNLADVWGVGLWNTAYWSGGSSVQKKWIQAEGLGITASLRMLVQSEAEVLWISTDYSIVIGEGIL